MDKKALLIPILSASVLTVGIVGGSIFLLMNAASQSSSSPTHSTKQIANTAELKGLSLEVKELPSSSQIIGGSLQVTGDLSTEGSLSAQSLLLAPKASPTNQGELYIQASDNTLRYFNGADEVNISSLNQTNSTVGQLVVTTTELQATLATLSDRAEGVVTLQGQTGAIVLTGGQGIAL